MTNYEFYKKEIEEAIKNETLGDWCYDHGIYKYTDTDLYTAMRISLWLMDEYKEPKQLGVDWTKVEVDTPVLVCVDEKEDEWEIRHFAYADNYGNPRIWCNGKTSLTVKNKNDVYHYHSTQLLSEEEMEEFRCHV